MYSQKIKKVPLIWIPVFMLCLNATTDRYIKVHVFCVLNLLFNLLTTYSIVAYFVTTDPVKLTEVSNKQYLQFCEKLYIFLGNPYIKFII